MNVKNILFLLLAFGMTSGVVRGMGSDDLGSQLRRATDDLRSQLMHETTVLNPIIKQESPEESIKKIISGIVPDKYEEIPTLAKLNNGSLSAQADAALECEGRESNLLDWTCTWINNGKPFKETVVSAVRLTITTIDGGDTWQLLPNPNKSYKMILPKNSTNIVKTSVPAKEQPWNSAYGREKLRTAKTWLARWTYGLGAGITGLLMSATTGLFSKTWRSTAIKFGIGCGVLTLLSLLKRKSHAATIQNSWKGYVSFLSSFLNHDLDDDLEKLKNAKETLTKNRLGQTHLPLPDATLKIAEEKITELTKFKNALNLLS